MSGTLLAVIVTVVGLLSSAIWFGAIRRRKAETEIGIQSLASMKWRDCIAVVLESLQRDGYSQAADPLAIGDGGTEFLLEHDSGKVLLGYKHGTAYNLTGANVRDFAAGLPMRGAARGILLTLGSVETDARLAAVTSDVELLDGTALWPKVREYVEPETLHLVHSQARARIRKGLWLGNACSVVAGLTIYLLGNLALVIPAQSAAKPAVQAVAAAPFRAQVPGSDTEMLKQLNATARAMAAVAILSPAELAERRAGVARAVSLLAQVDTAVWSAPRTLLLTLNQTDGKDKDLVDEVCRTLVNNEEMRFTRIQLEPPSGSELAVRWKLCE